MISYCTRRLTTSLLIAPLLKSAPIFGQALVSIKNEFGCRGDGSDEQALIQSAIEAVSRKGQALFFPPGIYGHSDVLGVKGCTLIGSGKNSELRALNPRASTVQVGEGHSNLSGLLLTSPLAKGRESRAENTALSIVNAEACNVSAVAVRGGSGAGIYVSGSNNVTISDCLIESTGADGIHLTGSSARCRILRNQIVRSGDDGIAVVGYKSDSDAVSLVEISGNRVELSNARGISVLGGRNILVHDNLVSASRCAGVYVANETGYATRPPVGVTLSGNTLTACVLDKALGHAAVMIFSSDAKSPCKNVAFIKNNLFKSGVGMRACVNVGPNADSVLVEGNKMSGIFGSNLAGVFQLEDSTCLIQKNELVDCQSPIVLLLPSSFGEARIFDNLIGDAHPSTSELSLISARGNSTIPRIMLEGNRLSSTWISSLRHIQTAGHVGSSSISVD